MLGRLMPREGKFFDLFNAHAARIVEGSRELAAMMDTFTELEEHAQRIDDAEHAADKVTARDHRAAAQDLHHAARPRRRSTS